MVEKKVLSHGIDVVESARGFWEKYSKIIIYSGLAVILLAGGWLAYKYWVKLPKEQKANDVIYATQAKFTEFSNAPSDSLKANLAQKCINGEGTVQGALKIISKYSGTAAANLCEYYAGACYLHLKQFDKAIRHLKNFTTDATQIKSRAYGMIGDAYSELKKNGEALDYYKKAADVNKKDEFTSSEFLFRAGRFAESIGKSRDAIDLYKKIKEEYPTTERAATIDRYLARLGDFSE